MEDHGHTAAALDAVVDDAGHLQRHEELAHRLQDHQQGREQGVPPIALEVGDEAFDHWGSTFLSGGGGGGGGGQPKSSSPPI